MEAKDTEMTIDQINKLGVGHLRYGIFPALVKAQAEISFKAGIREVVKWIESVPTREIDGAPQYIVAVEQWQAQLKEWEVKE